MDKAVRCIMVVVAAVVGRCNTSLLARSDRFGGEEIAEYHFIDCPRSPSEIHYARWVRVRSDSLEFVIVRAAPTLL